MAIKWKLLRKAALFAVVTMTALVGPATNGLAQNIMRLRFDTVTATPGEIVTVNVDYNFTATHDHNIQDFRVRMQYDTNQIRLVRYIMDGTASAAFTDTTGSHLGILAIDPEQQELDLTNLVLIRIQFKVDSMLADTAWVRWDSNYKYASSIFELPSDNVDSVSFEDGWIRVPQREAVGPVLSQTDGIFLFPNPAREEVTVRSEEGALGAPVDIELFDAAGQTCWKGRLAGPVWRIPSSLAPGAYLVMISTEGKFFEKRLILEPR